MTKTMTILVECSGIFSRGKGMVIKNIYLISLYSGSQITRLLSYVDSDNLFYQI
jgi:hypothetical protein